MVFPFIISTVITTITVIQPIQDQHLTYGYFGNFPNKTFGSLLIPKTTPTPTPVLNLPQNQTTKKHYTIAFLGDSMIDTLGNNFPEIDSALSTFFPRTTFTLLNYGVGATSIDTAINRIILSYEYKGKIVPSVISQKPDLIIVESFAYNPYADADGLTRYNRELVNLIRVLREKLPKTKIILATTIAPNSRIFADGAPGISLTSNEKRERTTLIKQYLATAVSFAKTNGIPLANLYHVSIDKNSDGNPIYINNTDHIHYSAIGRMLFAQKIIETITANHLIE